MNLCLDRVRSLASGRDNLRLLEPTVGDGAFVRGLRSHPVGRQVSSVLGLEIIAEEVAKAAESLRDSGLKGEVLEANVLEWNRSATAKFDVAVGNPPYLRFQFLSLEDRQRAISVGTSLGVASSAVSNLWISVLLLTLARLEPGGFFSLIVPMEFMTGVSASRVRAWLLQETCDVSIDLFAPGAFPAVLQEVVVLSGRRAGGRLPSSSTVNFIDHNGGTRSWKHEVSAAESTWTSYLLTAPQLSAWNHVGQLAGIRRLGSVARFTVSTVTGANGFFCVSSKTAAKYELNPWTLPLLSRIRYAPGLMFDGEEHKALAGTEVPAWMLSFSADAESPSFHTGPSAYIASGEEEGLDIRYKCRIRHPWYRVPVVTPGTLMLSKRSNGFPRLVVNKAGVVTTDTVYRGVMLQGTGLVADDVAASFHNSLTILSAEVGGRSFGGGVLELVPSEIASLFVPVSSRARSHLGELDHLSRHTSGGDDLIERTDELLLKWIPELDEDALETIGAARRDLALRRTSRSHGHFFGQE